MSWLFDCLKAVLCFLIVPATLIMWCCLVISDDSKISEVSMRERYIIGRSSCGKTRSLLELAANTGAAVVCKNPDAMRVKAQSYGIFRLEFFGYDEMHLIDDGRKIVVDEIGDMLGAMYGLKLAGFSLTDE